MLCGARERGAPVDAPRAARLASFFGRAENRISHTIHRRARHILELDEEAKQLVHDLGTAINAAVENSGQVAAAIERLREAGYEMELTLRLEIGLRPHEEEDEDEEEELSDAEGADGSGALELTDEDLRTLRRMKIRIDDAE